MIKKVIVCSLLLIPQWVMAEKPKVLDILKKQEAMMEMTSDVRAKVTVTQQKTDQGVKVMEMIYYCRDSDDSFLIVMSAPETDKGNG